MLIKENDEKTNLINLVDYHTNFFYKNQKFKKSFKNKILLIREYFSEYPKLFLLAEITIGIICFGLPLVFLFYILRNLKYQKDLDENTYNQYYIQAFFPIIFIITTLLISTGILIILKIRKIFKSRL